MVNTQEWFGDRGIRLSRRWNDEDRIRAEDIAETIAAAEGGGDDVYDGWREGLFLLRDGRFLYLTERQCDTCGSGGPVLYTSKDKAYLIRMRMTDFGREALGLKL